MSLVIGWLDLLSFIISFFFSSIPAVTTSGRGTISSPVKAVMSTMTTSQNFSKKSSVDSFSSLSSSSFVISTTSKAAAAMSSLVNLVPNAGRKHFVHKWLVKAFVILSCFAKEDKCLFCRGNHICNGSDLFVFSSYYFI